MVEVAQVLRRLSMQTAVHNDAEIVRDSLWYIEPTQLGVKKPRQDSVKLLCAADQPSRSVQHSMQLVCRRFRCIHQESVTVVEPRRYECMDECGCKFRVQCSV